MQEPTDPNWWRSIGCHMSPSWNLSMSTTADEKKLKENIEIRLPELEYAPDFMQIESLLFRAWLDVSSLRLQNSKQSLTTALSYVKKAEKYLLKKYDDKDTYVGYGTVVYSFLLWLYDRVKDEEEFRTAELKLLDLLKSEEGLLNIGELHPSARAYVHATHAFALSRLGEEHMRQSVNLFKTALRRQPNNKHWQFWQARILFRICNMHKLATFGYDNQPLSPVLQKKFQVVRTILAKIYEADPNFHWANAYLGYVSFFLTETVDHYDGESLVKEALDHESTNIDIVLVAAKLYRQRRKFKRGIEILHNIPEHFKTAECYFQLSTLLYEMWRDGINGAQPDPHLLIESLKHIETALDKDSCKSPALVKRAEMYAKHPQLDENFPEKATGFYMDVTNSCNERANKRNAFHATRSMTYKDVATIFSPLKRVNNCYNHFKAIVEADEFASRNDEGILIFSPEYEKSAKRVTGILFKISQGKGQLDENDVSVRMRAKLYLANCNQILGESRKSAKIYETLLQNNELQDCKIFDVNFGLAECYYRQAKYEKAKAKLQDSKKNNIEKKKLLADIYVSEAKQFQKQMKDKLTEAIYLGNLEGCLEMMLANGNFCEDFFSVEGRIAQILANINKQVAVNVDPVKTIKITIKEKYEEALMQPMKLPSLTEAVFEETFNGLSTLRAALLELECSLLCDETTSMCSTEEGSTRCSEEPEGRCDRQVGTSTSWPTDCPRNAKEVLKKALSLFNQSIVCLQVTLLSSEVQHKVPQNSAQFPIIPWISEDEADEFLASEDLQNLLIEQFPDDFEAYIPPDVFDYLLRMQPRVDKKNLWLEVLSKFVEDLTGDTLPQETCRHSIGNESIPQTFCTVRIARKSSEQAEQLVLTILQKCQELLNKTKANVVQFTNREE